jgi:hypothetical protein
MFGPMHWGQTVQADWMGWGMPFAPILMIAFWAILVVAVVWLAVEVRRLRIAASQRS